MDVSLTFLESIGLSVQDKKKFKMDFQHDCYGNHLRFPIRTILVIFDGFYQVSGQNNFSFFDVAHRLEQLYEITNMPYNRKESAQRHFLLLP